MGTGVVQDEGDLGWMERCEHDVEAAGQQRAPVVRRITAATKGNLSPLSTGTCGLAGKGRVRPAKKLADPFMRQYGYSESARQWRPRSKGACWLPNNPAFSSSGAMHDVSRPLDAADGLPSHKGDAAPFAMSGDQLQPVLERLALVLERALGMEGHAPAGEAELAPHEETAWQEPGLSDAVVQQLRFSAPRSGPAISYKVAAGQAQALHPGLLLSKGTRISFDAYLNSFYEHYWSSHAPVEDLTLRLFGTGDVTVEFFRALPDGSSYPLGHRRIRLDLLQG